MYPVLENILETSIPLISSLEDDYDLNILWL